MAIAHVPPNVHIGRVIRNAVVFDPRNWQGDVVDPESLVQTVVRLFALLRARIIDFVLVGGVARLQYVDGRNTEDIDLIMVATLLHDYKPPLEPLFGELAQYVSEPDLAAMRDAVAEIERRIKRFGAGPFQIGP